MYEGTFVLSYFRKYGTFESTLQRTVHVQCVYSNVIYKFVLSTNLYNRTFTYSKYFRKYESTLYESTYCIILSTKVQLLMIRVLYGSTVSYDKHLLHVRARVQYTYVYICTLYTCTVRACK